MNGFKRFDGGVIKISGDRKKATDWYCRHFDLKVGWDSPEEGMTVLFYPSGFGMTVESMRPDEKLESESNIRFCFETADINEAHTYLVDNGIETSNIYKNVAGISTFDFYDLEGTKLSAVEARPQLVASVPHSRFLFFYLHIGVKDVPKSVEWYKNHLKLKIVAENAEKKYAILECGEQEEFAGRTLYPWPIYILEMSEQHFSKRKDSKTLPYFVPETVEDYKEAYKYFKANNIESSELVGDLDNIHLQVSDFHIYDPDGNRLNFWIYSE